MLLCVLHKSWMLGHLANKTIIHPPVAHYNPQNYILCKIEFLSKKSRLCLKEAEKCARGCQRQLPPQPCKAQNFRATTNNKTVQANHVISSKAEESYQAQLAFSYIGSTFLANQPGLTCKWYYLSLIFHTSFNIVILFSPQMSQNVHLC